MVIDAMLQPTVHLSLPAIGEYLISACSAWRPARMICLNVVLSDAEEAVAAYDRPPGLQGGFRKGDCPTS
jgi:hypothetical protein